MSNAEYHIDKGITVIAKRLYEDDFPANFTILCFNCNCGKARNNGIGPRQVEAFCSSHEENGA